jgi:hypothetical protein
MDIVTWDFNATFAYLIKQEVVKIAEGIDRINVQSQWGGGTPDMVHAIGRPWGELYGSGMSVDSASGLPLLTTAGAYVTNTQKYFGNVLPKFTGGIQNTFKVMKNFTIIANFDYQFGGKFFSLSDMWGSYSGLTAKTSGLNDKGVPIREAVEDGGGVHVFGVDKDSRLPVDYYVDAQTYYHNLYNNDIYDYYVYDLTYIKLREFSVGYNIPVAKLGGVSNYIQSATLSLIAQNPWLIYTKTKDFDPSEIAYAGGERGQFPGIRSFGANLKITF